VYAEQAELVRAALPDPDARTAFFARIDLVVNVLTLALQAVATPALLRIAGIGATLAILPALVAAGFAALAVAPGLSTLAVFQVARRTGEYAIARPARELLYTAVPREDKYQAKHLIDTVAYRGGDQVGIWLDAALRAAGAAGIAVALPLALAWGALSVWLGATRFTGPPGTSPPGRRRR
jgi:ATP:ADP antiporter, AAA family